MLTTVIIFSKIMMLILTLLILACVIEIINLRERERTLKEKLEDKTILSERILLKLNKLKIANRRRNFLIYDKLNNTIHEDDFEL